MPKKKRIEKLIWDDCICSSIGSSRTVHSRECRRNHRRLYINRKQVEIRKERKEKHLCSYCGKPVKPKVIIPKKCSICKKKAEEWLKNKNNKINVTTE